MNLKNQKFYIYILYRKYFKIMTFIIFLNIPYEYQYNEVFCCSYIGRDNFVNISI